MRDPIGRSLLLHVLLIGFILLLPFGGNSDESHQGDSGKHHGTPGTIVPPPNLEVEVGETDKQRLKRIAPHSDEECATFYGGIGIYDNYEGIYSVVDGYPAARAGIKPGDELLSPTEVRGDVGTSIRVVIRRGYTIHIFDLIRDKICTS